MAGKDGSSIMCYSSQGWIFPTPQIKMSNIYDLSSGRYKPYMPPSPDYASEPHPSQGPNRPYNSPPHTSKRTLPHDRDPNDPNWLPSPIDKDDPIHAEPWPSPPSDNEDMLPPNIHLPQRWKGKLGRRVVARQAQHPSHSVNIPVHRESHLQTTTGHRVVRQHGYPAQTNVESHFRQPQPPTESQNHPEDTPASSFNSSNSTKPDRRRRWFRPAPVVKRTFHRLTGRVDSEVQPKDWLRTMESKDTKTINNMLVSLSLSRKIIDDQIQAAESGHGGGESVRELKRTQKRYDMELLELRKILEERGVALEDDH
ncbi:hypothetical protein T439DRAFT_383205 [Meredithblackwellia eburnea MCA 4105]